LFAAGQFPISVFRNVFNYIGVTGDFNALRASYPDEAQVLVNLVFREV
jgi:hypothetical protein